MQHSKNIIHRDLKADNIFFASPGVVKLGDFGFGTSAAPTQMLSTFCGSIQYAAPELLTGESCYVGGYVDIWAFGVLLYFMVTGVMPFSADTDTPKIIKRKILSGTYEMPDFVCAECASLIGRILKQTPCERPTMSQIRQSEWFAGQEFPRAFGERSSHEAEVVHAMRHMGIPDGDTEQFRYYLRNPVGGTPGFYA